MIFCYMQALPFSDALKLIGYLKDWADNLDMVSHLVGAYFYIFYPVTSILVESQLYVSIATVKKLPIS